jgi:prepilin-type N-terminal cleavage/methylation domain-containing protein
MISHKRLSNPVAKNNYQGSEAGFTLVELMVVVAIIAILAAIGLPKMSAFVKTAETSEAVEQSARIVKAIQGYVDTHTSVTEAAMKTSFDTYTNLSGVAGEAQITTLIPHVSLPATYKFVYTVSLGFTAGETIVCIKSWDKDGDGTEFIMYSNTESTDATWEKNVFRGLYIDPDNVTAVAGGSCTAAGLTTGT